MSTFIDNNERITSTNLSGDELLLIKSSQSGDCEDLIISLKELKQYILSDISTDTILVSDNTKNKLVYRLQDKSSEGIYVYRDTQLFPTTGYYIVPCNGILSLRVRDRSTESETEAVRLHVNGKIFIITDVGKGQGEDMITLPIESGSKISLTMHSHYNSETGKGQQLYPNLVQLQLFTNENVSIEPVKEVLDDDSSVTTQGDDVIIDWSTTRTD